ncbi:MAG: hypothetical protein LBL98_00955 [Ruminococcus sp.]|jgi:flagellar operon protein|nr:hypothetical protein [Ruminococcus sp.]
MTIQNDYLKARSVTVTTGQVNGFPNAATRLEDPSDSPFARELRAMLAENGTKTAIAEGIGIHGDSTVTSTVEFSKHAISRMEARGIDMDAETLSRLTRSLNLAKAKNCSESLVLIDGDAYLVNVNTNKVITAMTEEDIRDSIFTNIDSTIIG